MSDSLFEIELPKWSGIVVTGVSVSPSQAAEIIIRTDNWYISTNDKEWESQIALLIGAEIITSGINTPADFKCKYGVLDIYRLNNDQIASSYIGGPNGWCKWDGTIELSSKNVGKYPNVGGLFDEWVLIAQAFPFLDLTCQIYDGEYCSDSKPIIEFIVKDGVVTIQKPESIIKYDEVLPMDEFIKTMNDANRERGCDINQLSSALQITETSIRNKLNETKV